MFFGPTKLKNKVKRTNQKMRKKKTTTQKTEKNSREAEEKPEEGQGNIVLSFRTKS